MRNAIWRCSVATHTSNLIFEAALCATVSGCTAHTSPPRPRSGCLLAECICKYSRRTVRRDLVCTLLPPHHHHHTPVWRRRGAASYLRVNGVCVKVRLQARRGAQKRRLRELSPSAEAAPAFHLHLSASIQATFRLKSRFNHRHPDAATTTQQRAPAFV